MAPSSSRKRDLDGISQVSEDSTCWLPGNRYLMNIAFRREPGVNSHPGKEGRRDLQAPIRQGEAALLRAIQTSLNHRREPDRY